MLLSTENAIAVCVETGDGDYVGGRIWRARDATDSLRRSLPASSVSAATPFPPGNEHPAPSTGQSPVHAGRVLGVTPAWLMAGIGRAPDDKPQMLRGTKLRKQLDLVKKLHDQTAEAISALEMEFERLNPGRSVIG